MNEDTISDTIDWLKIKPEINTGQDYMNRVNWIRHSPDIEDMAKAIKYQAERIKALEQSS